MKLTLLLFLLIFASVQTCHSLSCYNGSKVTQGKQLVSETKINCPNNGQLYKCFIEKLDILSGVPNDSNLMISTVPIVSYGCTFSSNCSGDYCSNREKALKPKPGEKTEFRFCSFDCCDSDYCNGGSIITYSGKMMMAFLLLTIAYSKVLLGYS